MPTSIFGLLTKDLNRRYFDDELNKERKINQIGLVGSANKAANLNSSTFFITLTDECIDSFQDKHTVFGVVAEGLDVLEKLNELVIDDKSGRPLQNIRVKHTMVIDEGGLEDKEGEYLESTDQIEKHLPSRSPSPVTRDPNGFVEYTESGNQLTEKQLMKATEENQTRARAQVLEMIDDLPDADIEPPKNVLFVCKLNPVTQDEDLEIIFSRFGRIKSCEVVKDWKTGDSLQYAFIEFEDVEACEKAYFKMNGVLIDERRIHVDFS